MSELQPPRTDENKALDDKIDEWHDGGGLGVPLHEYLGMTWEEYKTWVSHGERRPGDKYRDDILSLATEFTIWQGDAEHDKDNGHNYHLTVRQRAPGQWAVLSLGGRILTKAGNWTWDHIPSGRSAYHLSRTRFARDDAIEMARKHVDKIRVGGMTHAQMLVWAAEREREQTIADQKTRSGREFS